MADKLFRLKPRERRGSKPRCHLLTDGDPAQVAKRLSQLATPHVDVTEAHHWMPRGFDELDEAQLHNAPRLVSTEVGAVLKEWWLATGTILTRTPNFDIAATCSVQGRGGLLLVEAKAHDDELAKEAAGRRLIKDASEESKANHERIGLAIDDACRGLQDATSLHWQISRDHHYQMSNRFAWAWKLADLGIPVVLVYLGFLRANEMIDRGLPFTDHSHWEEVVKEHSEPLFPTEAWDREWQVNGQPLFPLIRSIEVPLISCSA